MFAVSPCVIVFVPSVAQDKRAILRREQKCWYNAATRVRMSFACNIYSLDYKLPLLKAAAEINSLCRATRMAKSAESHSGG